MHGFDVYEVNWIVAHMPNGSITIQENHAPTIVYLKEKKPLIMQLSSGEEKEISVISGLLHISRNEVKLFLF